MLLYLVNLMDLSEKMSFFALSMIHPLTFVKGRIMNSTGSLHSQKASLKFFDIHPAIEGVTLKHIHVQLYYTPGIGTYHFRKLPPQPAEESVLIPPES